MSTFADEDADFGAKAEDSEDESPRVPTSSAARKRPRDHDDDDGGHTGAGLGVSDDDSDSGRVPGSKRGRAIAAASRGGSGSSSAANEGPGDGDDDDDDDDDDDEDDDEDDDDDDDDDDNDDDEPASGAKPRRKRHRKRRTDVDHFFEDAAEEDDDDAGKDRPRTTEQLRRTQQQRIEAIRREAEETRRRKASKPTDQEIVRDLQARAKQTRYLEQGNDDVVLGEGTGSASGVLRQTDLPTPKDPRLFMIRVRENREREIIVALCNKFIASASEGKILAITSAFTTSKGIIFVEAHREAYVAAAVSGIPDVFAWRAGSISMVQPADIPSAIAIKSKISRLQKGGWVRMTKGEYKGDLARVEDVMDGGARVLIKAVPRINFQRLGMSAEQRRALSSRGARPPQRLFDAAEVRAAIKAAGREPRIETKLTRFGAQADLFASSLYHEGFLLRECPLSHVTTEGAAPTMEELRWFRPRRAVDLDGAEDDPAAAAEAMRAKDKEWQASLSMSLGSGQRSAAAADAKIVHGDNVVVVRGDLHGLSGRVKSIDEAEGTVLIEIEKEMAAALDFTDDVPVPVADLVKTFDIGSRVKVVGGMHQGQTGVVVITRVGDSGDHSAVLTLDAGGRRVEVLVRDLRTTREIVTSVEDLQGFRLYDLVDITSAAAQQPEAGCIIAVGATDLAILNTSNTVERYAPSAVRHRRGVRAAAGTAMDSTMRPVRVGDVVRITEEPWRGRDGVVKHVSNGYLFLHSPRETKNSGIFVVRSRSVVLAGGKARGNAAAAAALGISGAGAVAPAAMGGMDAGRGTGGMMVARSGGPGGRFAGRGRGRGVADPDRLLNATVRILRSTHKSKLGIVRQLQGENVLVELHAGQQKVTVPKSMVRREEAMPGGGSSASMSSRGMTAGKSIEELRAMARARQSSSHGTAQYRTAQYGTAKYATANYGGAHDAMRTAAYSGATPAMSGRTPALGGATPAYGGGATPAYGGGATPAYGGGTTPGYHGAGAGGSTPAYGGSATPAYSGHSNGASAGVWNAETPGPGADDDGPGHFGGGNGGGDHADSLPVLARRGACVVVTSGPSSGQLGVVTGASGPHAVAVALSSGHTTTVPSSSLVPQEPKQGARVIRASDGATGSVEGEVTESAGQKEVMVRFEDGKLSMQLADSLVPMQ